MENKQTSSSDANTLKMSVHPETVAEFYRLHNIFEENYRSTTNQKTKIIQKSSDSTSYQIKQWKKSMKYVAISYVWSDGVVQDKKLMHPFLKKYSGNLWIDQLCINQEDQAEVTQQLSIVGQIYNQAEEVVILLNNLSAYKEFVEGLKQLVGFNVHTTPQERQATYVKVALAVRQIANDIRYTEADTWPNRVWTQVEKLQGRRLRIASWQHSVCIDSLYTYHVMTNAELPYKQQVLQMVAGVLGMPIREGRITGLISQPWVFGTAYTFMSQKSCANPIDRVVAVLALLPHPVAVPEFLYTDKNSAMINIAEQLYMYGDTSIFGMTQYITTPIKGGNQQSLHDMAEGLCMYINYQRPSKIFSHFVYVKVEAITPCGIQVWTQEAQIEDKVELYKEDSSNLRTLCNIYATESTDRRMLIEQILYWYTLPEIADKKYIFMHKKELNNILREQENESQIKTDIEELLDTKWIATKIKNQKEEELIALMTTESYDKYMQTKRLIIVQSQHAGDTRRMNVYKIAIAAETNPINNIRTHVLGTAIAFSKHKLQFIGEKRLLMM